MEAIDLTHARAVTLPDYGGGRVTGRPTVIQTMTSSYIANFKGNYQTHLKHLKHLKLKGLQPKTIEAYS